MNVNTIIEMLEVLESQAWGAQWDEVANTLSNAKVEIINYRDTQNAPYRDDDWLNQFWRRDTDGRWMYSVVSAIKQYREEAGVSLKVAKNKILALKALYGCEICPPDAYPRHEEI